jgi:hypothetical protein
LEWSQVYEILEEFALTNKNEIEEIAFPPSLIAEQRKKLHLFADKLGLRFFATFQPNEGLDIKVKDLMELATL